ncbi:MAG: radical SAM family heme chaperone HemW [Oscillospiraceae bacterium]|nr:radical SAM family heme chaperone HemW [Oscillospiraceae bacterium]
MKKGVYIHVPFCKGKCPYCDFYSITDLGLTEEYAAAVLRNLRLASIKPQSIDSVYFGGGTPSLLAPSSLQEIINLLSVTDNAEVTIEVNPDDASLEYLRAVKGAGVNRLSFGVQSLIDGELAFLGRRHNARAACLAIEAAAKADFENIAADIMLGLPGQSLESLSETISKLSALPIKSVSAYMLTIEPHTPFYMDLALQKAMPREDLTADLYLHAVKMLADRGFEQYEISNFAVEGYECRHNLKYWSGGEYYGIGPTAHSCLDGVRAACKMSVREFIEADVQEATALEKAGGFDETAMLALRLTKTGLELSEAPERKEKLLRTAEPFIKAGLIKQSGSAIMLTPKGCLVSNEIIVKLLY